MMHGGVGHCCHIIVAVGVARQERGEVAVVTWCWCQRILLDVCMVLIIIATLLLLLALQDENEGE